MTLYFKCYSSVFGFFALVALGFIKSLVDYIKPEGDDAQEVTSESQLDFDEEEWDEMHAHDMVLNDMVNQAGDPFDDEDGEDPLEAALAKKAEEEKEEFLNRDENDTTPQV